MLHFVCSIFAVHADLWKSMWKTLIIVKITTENGIDMDSMARATMVLHINNK